MSPSEVQSITALVVAISTLIGAIATAVAVFRRVPAKIDTPAGPKPTGEAITQNAAASIRHDAQIQELQSTVNGLKGGTT